MQKSEALDTLVRITETEERDFSDFGRDCNQLEEIIKEYPQYSGYCLSATVQMAGDKGFNSDIQPTVGNLFTLAALNLPAEEVIGETKRAFNRNPSFAFYLIPGLLKQRPELSAALFPPVMEKAAGQNANGSYRAISAVRSCVYHAAADDAGKMMDQIFAAGTNPVVQKGMYDFLGNLYGAHPEMKERIFSLLESSELLSPQNYASFYASLGKIGMTGEAESVRALKLMSSYLQKDDNTPASLTAAYKTIGEMMAASNGKTTPAMEEVVQTGLKNAANDKASQKTAWRLLGEHDKLCSSVSFCRRGEKNEENLFGLEKTENIKADEVCVLVLGGDGTRSEKALNGYLGDIYRLLKENDLQEKANVYGVVYDFGDFMNLNYARSRQMEKYGRKIHIKKELSSETMDPKYIGEIFTKAVLPRISADNGSRRLSEKEAAAGVRRLNIVAHCHGAYTALRLEEMMQQKMKELGYDKRERENIQRQLLVVAQSPYCPLGESKSTFVSFASVKDDEVSHYNNFEKYVRSLNGREEIPLSYFPGRRGNIFLAGDMGKGVDQHNFWGYHPSPEMNREGQALTALSAKVLVNGVKNSLTPEQGIPEVKALAADTEESRKLFNAVSENGEKVYNRILAESIIGRRNQSRQN